MGNPPNGDGSQQIIGSGLGLCIADPYNTAQLVRNTLGADNLIQRSVYAPVAALILSGAGQRCDQQVARDLQPQPLLSGCSFVDGYEYYPDGATRVIFRDEPLARLALVTGDSAAIRNCRSGVVSTPASNANPHT
jgi:hypothetical protein